jgi:hypothetical protein
MLRCSYATKGIRVQSFMLFLDVGIRLGSSMENLKLYKEHRYDLNILANVQCGRLMASKMTTSQQITTCSDS